MQSQDLHLRSLKVSQASLEAQKSVLQIAESFTSIYRTELTESKQGKKISSLRNKLNSRRRTRTREHAAAGTRTRTRS